jgi:hypothetical protein
VVKDWLVDTIHEATKEYVDPDEDEDSEQDDRVVRRYTGRLWTESIIIIIINREFLI